jgi:hypothetical protein
MKAVCPECETALAIPPHMADRKVKCSSCGLRFLPAPPPSPTPPELSEPQLEEIPLAAVPVRHAPDSEDEDEPFVAPRRSRTPRDRPSVSSAIGVFLTDPLGSQAKAFEQLGPGAAALLGSVMGGMFVIGGMTGSVAGLKKYFPDRGPDLEFVFGFAAVYVVPFVALVLAFLGIGLVFGKGADFAKAMFGAGAATLPLAIVQLLSPILGLANIELVIVLSFVACCSCVLLLNASLITLQGLSTRQSLFLTPILLLVAAYLAKVLFMTLVNLGNKPL